MYRVDGTGAPVFRQSAAPGAPDLQALRERIALRIGQTLFTLQTVPARSPEWLDHPNGAARAGEFRAVVDPVLPMCELVRAHEMGHSRTHFGKVVLVND